MRVKGGPVVLGVVAILGAGLASASTPKLGRGTVVSVAGQALSKKTVDHWIRIAALSEAANRPGRVIVPTDPPRFARCIKAVRAKLPSLAHTSTRTLRLDCRQLFGSLSHQILGFLIQAHWYEDLASADHIKITHRHVVRVFRRARAKQFRTPGEFRTFLRQTGQTVSDLLFRFRVNLAFQALLKHIHLRPLKAQERLDREARRRYRPRTRCARYYIVAGCSNFSTRR